MRESDSDEAHCFPFRRVLNGGFLEVLLPRFFPDLSFQCVPHEGKQDLEKSIPRKLKAWREPGVHFCVIRDNDSGDCHALKERLFALCKSSGRGDTLIRIACQELEAWYLGDPDVMAEAFANDKLRMIGKKARYRDPDAVARPSAEVRKLVPEFQKVSGARRMACHLTRDRNRSASFRTLLRGIENL